MNELLAYLAIADLENASAQDLLDLVGGALEECQPTDERYPWLVAAEAELLEDKLPLLRLRRFAARFPLCHRPEALAMEEEFRQIARELSDEEWRTSHYLTLAEAIRSWDDERLEAYLEARHQAIQSAWKEYLNAPLTQTEVTAESYVGHRLLGEGMEAWLRALELDSDSEALAEAEWGARLLVAVQMLHQRVARSLGKPND